MYMYIHIYIYIYVYVFVCVDVYRYSLRKRGFNHGAAGALEKFLTEHAETLLQSTEAYRYLDRNHWELLSSKSPTFVKTTNTNAIQEWYKRKQARQ